MKLVGRTMLSVLGVWHGLAAVQNIFDILASTGAAPGLRPFASKNAALIGKVLRPVHPSQFWIMLSLVGVSATEAAVAVVFARGAVAGDDGELGFALSLALFGAFFVVDDAFDDYELGADHRAIFTLVATTYAAYRATEA